ncbi:leucine-rich repeat domain-containing protein [Lentilitoribacter sp. Alg239-R112]|uniref:leucine-rich repeat domain-containing protein n=1 Tax=Lentilitoribacter sp. Alg239-R112 TaxID=2305987 RepID=UPI0013A68BC3|nr:leucine-rich repeat domain-containing protein [Lentilitoribacter sp. Alg239-R112]
MPLSHERPSQEYMRELKEVARAAAGLVDHLGKVNLLPDGFPIEQVEGFCKALTRLPSGTAEGSIAPLRAADSELNRVRQRFIPAHDEGEEEPLVPRNGDFDLRLVGLMAAVRAAIEQYKLESGEELDTDVTPDLPETDKADEAIEAAILATTQTSQDVANVDAMLAEADDETRNEFETEAMLASDAGVQAQSAEASLKTERPRPTVIDWLSNGVENTASAMENQLAKHGEKLAQAGQEVRSGVGELLEINFPKLVKSLNVVNKRLTNIVVIFKVDGVGEQPHDFDYVEVYNRLLRGEMVPDSWAPFVTELDFKFNDDHHLDKEELERITGSPKEFADAALLSNLSHLRNLYLADTQVSDIAPLTSLTALRGLNLAGTQVLDVAPLSNLTALEYLSLGETRVMDIAPLSSLTALVYLGLGGTQVSDITPLANLTALKHLYLTSSIQVSDIAPLSNLTLLRYLNMGATGVSDIAPLSNLTALQSLYLGVTGVFDIAPLSNLAVLQHLDLMGTNVSDIAPLSNLTAMRLLDLTGTRVSDTSVLSHLKDLNILRP